MVAGQALAAVGAQITAMLLAQQKNANHVILAYLSIPTPVPGDLVQSEIVNPARMSQFLSTNFNTPYLLPDTDGTECAPEGYYGTFSQIYATAADLATPPPNADAAQAQVIAQVIAQARSALPAADLSVQMVASPDDWPLATGTSYWTTFRSSGADPTPAAGTAAAAPAPVWAVRPIKRLPTPGGLQIARAGTAAEDGGPVGPQPGEMPSHVSFRPVVLGMMPIRSLPIPIRPPPRPVPPHPVVPHPVVPPPVVPHPVAPPPIVPHPVDPPPPRPPPPPPPPPPIAASSSTFSIAFDHMMVATDYQSAGASIIDNVFVANPNWIIPGMSRGTLLPDPGQAAQAGDAPKTPGAAYGAATGLVVVRNVAISVKWSADDRAALQGAHGGLCIGPFALTGAPATTAADGTETYLMPAMTVIAIGCRRLPALPPRDAVPDSASPASDTPASPQPSPAGAST